MGNQTQTLLNSSQLILRRSDQLKQIQNIKETLENQISHVKFLNQKQFQQKKEQYQLQNARFYYGKQMPSINPFYKSLQFKPNISRGFPILTNSVQTLHFSSDAKSKDANNNNKVKPPYGSLNDLFGKYKVNREPDKMPTEQDRKDRVKERFEAMSGPDQEFTSELEKATYLKDRLYKLLDDPYNRSLHTEFVGYDTLHVTGRVQITTPDFDSQYQWVCLDRSPFYIESGGQVSDRGTVSVFEDSFEVLELKKIGGVGSNLMKIFVKIKSQLPLQEGAKMVCNVDRRFRTQVIQNHTSAHMLQAALIQVLGTTVKQAGSCVNDQYVRFDFTHDQALTQEQIAQVESIVNSKIQENLPVRTATKSLEEAQEEGAQAHFEDKYDAAAVRLVEIPGFSKELCGGTHAKRTGELGIFKIYQETSLSTGIRRIFALTGSLAFEAFQKQAQQLQEVADAFQVNKEAIVDEAKSLKEKNTEFQKTISKIKSSITLSQIPIFKQKIKKLHNKVNFLYLNVEDMEFPDMSKLCEEVTTEQPGFVIIVNQQANSDKFGFLTFISKEISGKIDLKSFASHAWEKWAIKGGGGPNLLRGGGINAPQDLEQQIEAWFSSNLK